MIIAIKITLIIVILISLVGAIAEKENERLRQDMAVICTLSVVGLVAILFLL